MKISILIPVHNEEKAVQQCVESCLNQTRKVDEIIVVDDGSTDRTAEILAEFENLINVVTLEVATGNKSYAQEQGLKHVTGDIFVATDGDTLLDSRFVEEMEKTFEESNAAAVSGYVKSLKHNWLTACREIDYVVAQRIHKHAEATMGFFSVVPGCAAAFRTEIFRNNITFDHDTLTEDLDFTYKLNELDFKIGYNSKAIVYTQDPADLRSYISQMHRWYGGGWQNIIKHRKIFRKPMAALELSLLYIEGIILPFVVIVLPLLNLQYFVMYLMWYFLGTYIVAAFAAGVDGRPDILLYAPMYLLIVAVNSFIFIQEFIEEVLFKTKKLTWVHPKRREMRI